MPWGGRKNAPAPHSLPAFLKHPLHINHPRIASDFAACVFVAHTMRARFVFVQIQEEWKNVSSHSTLLLLHARTKNNARSGCSLTELPWFSGARVVVREYTRVVGAPGRRQRGGGVHTINERESDACARWVLEPRARAGEREMDGFSNKIKMEGTVEVEENSSWRTAKHEVMRDLRRDALI